MIERLPLTRKAMACWVHFCEHAQAPGGLDPNEARALAQLRQNLESTGPVTSWFVTSETRDDGFKLRTGLIDELCRGLFMPPGGAYGNAEKDLRRALEAWTSPRITLARRVGDEMVDALSAATGPVIQRPKPGEEDPMEEHTTHPKELSGLAEAILRWFNYHAIDPFGPVTGKYLQECALACNTTKATVDNYLRTRIRPYLQQEVPLADLVDPGEDAPTAIPQPAPVPDLECVNARVVPPMGKGVAIQDPEPVTAPVPSPAESAGAASRAATSRGDERQSVYSPDTDAVLCPARGAVSLVLGLPVLGLSRMSLRHRRLVFQAARDIATMLIDLEDRLSVQEGAE